MFFWWWSGNYVSCSKGIFFSSYLTPTIQPLDGLIGKKDSQGNSSVNIIAITSTIVILLIVLLFEILALQ